MVVGQDPRFVVPGQEVSGAGHGMPETLLHLARDLLTNETEARAHGVDEETGGTGPPSLVGVELVE